MRLLQLTNRTLFADSAMILGYNSQRHRKNNLHLFDDVLAAIRARPWIKFTVIAR